MPTRLSALPPKDAGSGSKGRTPTDTLHRISVPTHPSEQTPGGNRDLDGPGNHPQRTTEAGAHRRQQRSTVLRRR